MNNSRSSTFICYFYFLFVKYLKKIIETILQGYLTNSINGSIMLAETNKRRRYMISSSLEEYLKTIYVLKKTRTRHKSYNNCKQNELHKAKRK